jgi:integrase/recombinase XerD
MVYRILRECARKAGLDGEIILNPNTGRTHYIHPHILRDSLAVDWLTLDDSGDSQKMLQEHLGHKRYETTARYFKLTPSQVARTADEVRRHRFGN